MRHHTYLEEIREADLSQLTMDGAIEHSAYLKIGRAEYHLHGLSEPEWMGDRALRLARRIRDLRHDQMAHRLAQLKGMIAAKQPAEQQIAAWEEERQTLEAALAT